MIERTVNVSNISLSHQTKYTTVTEFICNFLLNSLEYYCEAVNFPTKGT